MEYLNEWYAWIIYYIMLSIPTARMVGRMIMEENYNNEKGYKLIAKDGDHKWIWSSVAFAPLFFIVGAICCTIDFHDRHPMTGESKFFGKPPKKIRKEIAQKEHEKRAEELGIEP